MGIQHPIDAAGWTSPNMPLVLNDPVISSGTLMLLDLGHSMGQIAAGVPAEGALIPNVAFDEARSLIGDVTPDQLAAQFFTTGVATGDAVIERTPKKGIHVLMSQANDEAGDNARIVLPDAIKQYIVSNPTHTYAVSFWERLTRLGLTTTATLEFGIYNNAASPATQNGLALIMLASSAPATFIGRRNQTARPLGNTVRNLAVPGFFGTPLANVAQTEALWVCGGYGSFAAFMQNKSRSAVFYRLTVEDLTVSGRSYADFDAADLAAYTAAFGAGGRFAGDTVPTDPVTLP